MGTRNVNRAKRNMRHEPRTEETARTLAWATERFQEAVLERESARDALAEAVRLAYAEGMAETALAASCKVDRMTIRAWLGKRRHAHANAGVA